ncbi:molybdopterin-dependent oxidoreductase [Gemmobacter nectariphilus]|uniref:molybdopterin-dependent oxidoreductase n=1 Tax=Gemmobacter nectariphilus TaxID=220343 RepID=UPI000686820B|nr:molybdopterin-dependent oxidoreductase [Gemmobacter nectariphilus]
MLRIAPVALLAGLVLARSAASAETPDPLPVPTGAPVLTVTGSIGVHNAPDAAVFDMAMLQGLGSSLVETSTPWTAGRASFRGVPLYMLTDRLGVTEGMLFAQAVNDYSAEIPLEDAVPGRALVAWEMNGAPIPPRGQGPLWVIYPFDAAPEFQSEVIYSRAIWGLDRIEVRPAPEQGQ